MWEQVLKHVWVCTLLTSSDLGKSRKAHGTHGSYQELFSTHVSVKPTGDCALEPKQLNDGMVEK